VCVLTVAAFSSRVHPAQRPQVDGHQRVGVVAAVHQSQATAERAANRRRTA